MWHSQYTYPPTSITGYASSANSVITSNSWTSSMISFHQPAPTKIETLEDAKRCTTMCPHCGKLTKVSKRGCWPHKYLGDRCPGSNQIPRNAESDRRELWNGLLPPEMNERKASEGRW